MKLTKEQFQTIVEDHVQRVVDEMNTKTMMQIVYDNMVEHFGDVDSPQESLLEDILNHECDDTDSVHEFLVGTGAVSEDEAEQLITDFMAD